MTHEQGIHSVEWQNWSRVEYPGIYNFLIQTPSIYTGESLRAYTSLDGYYNFCVNGWVSNVSVFTIPRTPDTKLDVGSVKHSQRLSASSLKPWVDIVPVWLVWGRLAHILCSCNLFTLEKNTQHQNISLPCSWLPPSYQTVTYSEIADIAFATPQLKRRSESDDRPLPLSLEDK